MAKDQTYKLAVNNNLNLHLPTHKIKKLLIVGNTVNLFGFIDTENDRIDCFKMDEVNYERYFWLISKIKDGVKIVIIGDEEVKHYYEDLFSAICKLCSNNGDHLTPKYTFKKSLNNSDYINITNKLVIKVPHFDVSIVNPPYNAGEKTGKRGGTKRPDVEMVNIINKHTDLNIVIYPEQRLTQNTKLAKENNTTGHLKSVDLLNCKETFGILPAAWENVGIYIYDMRRTYNQIQLSYKDEKSLTYNTSIKSIKSTYENLTHKYKELRPIYNKLISLFNELFDKYGTMVNDGDGYIHEENRFIGCKSIGINKAKQTKLSRVKEYLKSGEYKYCLYKGSFNHDYDEVQEWNGENVDKLFEGQICWLTNIEDVYKNLKYWMEDPVFDLARKYLLNRHSGANDGLYRLFPANNFNMDHEKFKKMIDSYHVIFTAKDIEIMKKYNIHNIEKMLM